jgi:hypothetical protein
MYVCCVVRSTIAYISTPVSTACLTVAVYGSAALTLVELINAG